MTFIDIHIIQSVPPSNINRDDTGSPKSAVYGGVRRARVSSQAWKRATRAKFRAQLDSSEWGWRTKQAAELIGDRIIERSGMERAQAAERSHAVLKALGLALEPKRARKPKPGEEPEETSPYESSKYLVFFSSEQLDQLAELAINSEGTVNKKEAKARADTNHGIAVSLFGRMVADDASLNVDAAVQVAHAISTHAVDPEADYYTAVDDLTREDETGAGMIGTIEFNSSTLYRYATINVGGLVKNMGDADAAARAASLFTEAFVTSMPSGKSNTFANNTLPDAVVVTVREDQPLSMVGAFEDPVSADSRGLVAESAERLAQYAGDLDEGYGVPPVSSWIIRVGERTAGLDVLGDRVALPQLLEQVAGVIRRGGGDGTE